MLLWKQLSMMSINFKIKWKYYNRSRGEVQQRRSGYQLLLSRRVHLSRQRRSWSLRVNKGVVYQIEQELYVFDVGLKVTISQRMVIRLFYWLFIDHTTDFAVTQCVLNKHPKNLNQLKRRDFLGQLNVRWSVRFHQFDTRKSSVNILNDDNRYQPASDHFEKVRNRTRHKRRAPNTVRGKFFILFYESSPVQRW